MTRRQKIFFISCLALVTLLSVAFLWRYPAHVLIFALAVTSGLMLYITKSRTVFSVFLFCFILGPLSEALCIWFDAWNYSTPHILGFPFWLPFVWGNAGITIFYLADTLRQKA